MAFLSLPKRRDPGVPAIRRSWTAGSFMALASAEIPK